MPPWAMRWGEARKVLNLFPGFKKAESGFTEAVQFLISTCHVISTTFVFLNGSAMFLRGVFDFGLNQFVCKRQFVEHALSFVECRISCEFLLRNFLLFAHATTFAKHVWPMV